MLHAHVHLHIHAHVYVHVHAHAQASWAPPLVIALINQPTEISSHLVANWPVLILVKMSQVSSFWKGACRRGLDQRLTQYMHSPCACIECTS